uniref:Uncharacterized protein n=1 Tax=Panagrolaimus sp. PS1159 TaxID=55785 RepID=A0AC35F8N8_9BILA
MSKKPFNSRKAVKKAHSVITKEIDCQTDELLNQLLGISIADANVATTSTTGAQDLTKEQLAARLTCSQSLVKRLKALLNKERQSHKEEKQKFINFFHEIKVILHDSRHSYNIVKQDLADSAILFVNGRETLRQKLETYQDKCQTDLRAMRDQVARNDVVIEKANLTIISTKNEVEKALKMVDETRKKIQKVTTDKGFLDIQYKALVKKQNEKYIASGEMCPRCTATKQCLTEFTDNIKQLKSDVNRLEKENQAISTQKSSIESDLKNLQKKHDQVVHERNCYKEGDKSLREQLAKAKKALSESTNSPNRHTKVLEMLNSPARHEHSPTIAKETPPHLIKSDKSPTPVDQKPLAAERTHEPPPKKRTNGTSLSREEGEVSPEDDATTTKSPPIKQNDTRKSPPLKSGESRKRPLSPTPPKAEKPKQMDYVYVINDRQKPSDKPEPPSLLKQDIRPPPGYGSHPRVRHQSPPFAFDSPHRPSSQAYYDDYRMMQQQQQRPLYHQTSAYPQRQMPPNGYPPAPSGYSPQYPPGYHQSPQQQHSQPPNGYYRPQAAVNGGPIAPWHAREQSPQYPPYHQPQQRPPGESWTAWR